MMYATIACAVTGKNKLNETPSGKVGGVSLPLINNCHNNIILFPLQQCREKNLSKLRNKIHRQIDDLFDAAEGLRLDNGKKHNSAGFLAVTEEWHGLKGRRKGTINGR